MQVNVKKEGNALQKLVIYRHRRETVGKGYIERFFKHVDGKITKRYIALERDELDWIADTVAEMYYPNESPEGIAEAFK